MPNQVIIPRTSRLHYLGGMAALNLPSPLGTGDWHMEQTFRNRQGNKLSRSFISGVGCATDTTALLGDAGIYDCTQIINDLKIPHDSEPVFAANHARAIADLVISSILRDITPNHIQLDDWMPRETDKQSVFDLLNIAAPHLTEDQRGLVAAWANKNRE